MKTKLNTDPSTCPLQIRPCKFVGVPEPDFNSGSRCYLCRCRSSSSHLPFVVFNEMMIDSDFFLTTRCDVIVGTTLMETTWTDRSQISVEMIPFDLTVFLIWMPRIMKFEEWHAILSGI